MVKRCKIKLTGLFAGYNPRTGKEIRCSGAAVFGLTRQGVGLEVLFRKSQRAIVLFALLWLTIGSPGFATQPALLQGGQDSQRTIHYTLETLPNFVESGLEAYDRTPLGDRTPLILVHGIAAQNDHLFNWKHFLRFADGKKEFKRKYKIYLYYYDSSRSVADISESFRYTLKDFIQGLGGRPIKILAYSEGGLLTRNVMEDPYIYDHTLEVLAIATPFHGSPLANPEWVQQQVRTEPLFSVIRMTQRLAYKITGKLYPSFKEDFHWDNFDGAIPMKQYVRNNGPMMQQEYALARKPNFITYGSYFGVDVDASYIKEKLELTVDPPRERLMFSNLFKKNFLFSMVRNNIGKLPLASGHEIASASKSKEPPRKADLLEKTGDSNDGGGIPLAVPPAMAMPLVTEGADGSLEFSGQPTMLRASVSAPPEPTSIQSMMPRAELKQAKRPTVSMMMYNDGISPISSTLWLGRYTPNLIGASQPVEKLWDTLKSLKGNRNTRLFAGIDHRNWMDGETRTGSDVVQDLLNPDQKPRTVFEWIIDDLMS